MRYLFSLALLLLAGCAKEVPWVQPPPVPPDLWQQDVFWKAPAEVSAPVMQEPAQAAPERPARPNELVYAWEPGTEYDVPVQLGKPVDIAFQPGELLTVDVDGDRAPIGEEERRWEKHPGVSGHELGKDQQQPHLFYTCTHGGQRMGVTVATTRRMYHLELQCLKKTPVRIVRWTYPPSQEKPQPPGPPPVLPDPTQPQRFQIGYAASGSEALMPVWVGNDREHIYLIFPPTLLAEKAPMVREIGPTGPALVNSRQPAGMPVLVVDGLAAKLELRYGEGQHAQVVVITREQLYTVECPGHDQCPQWPRRPQRTVAR